MLPATPRPAHSALAGSSFLGARPADRDCFLRVCRALRSGSAWPVARFGSRRRLRIRPRFHSVHRLPYGRRSRSRKSGKLSAFDDERRRRDASRPSCQESQTEQCCTCDQGHKDLPFAKRSRTVSAEAAAGPEAPACTRYPPATFSTKVGFVHDEILAGGGETPGTRTMRGTRAVRAQRAATATFLETSSGADYTVRRGIAGDAPFVAPTIQVAYVRQACYSSLTPEQALKICVVKREPSSETLCSGEIVR